MVGSIGRSWRLSVVGIGALVAALIALVSAATASSGRHVLLVGTYHGIKGHYKSIQAAVRAAKPGDWILVAPGDYKERGYHGEAEPAGVLITTPNLHLRGMNRNTVVVDGTKPGAPKCSSKPKDQGKLNRDGVVVFKANDVWIENLTVCNFLRKTEEGNQIWWNGGDGTGQMHLRGLWGNYLTATSSYSSSVAGKLGPCCGVDYPAADYGIFSSNSSGGSFKYSYANNQADAAFYIGACRQRCNQTMQHDRGENSALCLSSTNAGGFLLIEQTECDHNKSGLVSNSQNNDDWPSPQIGLCRKGHKGPLGTKSCTVWRNNYIHDNNNPNVPGAGSGLSGASPVGTGLVLAGSTYVTLYHNRVVHNGAWGELIADLPDQENPPPQAPSCRGGILIAPGNCYYQAYGNVSEKNQFSRNGFFGNPSNGDIGVATVPHNPGNCFSKDHVPDGTDPAMIESNPLFAPSKGMCTKPNLGDFPVVGAQAVCATQLIAPCPGAPGAKYPRSKKRFRLPKPPHLPSMPNPCAGVPRNPWCP